MNRNQKIALGCGGAGCLGLIVVVIAGSLIWYFARSSNTNRPFNVNRSTNRNSNINSTNDNSDTNTNSTDAPDTETSTTLDDDAKHKLFQAASFTQDTALINRVLKKIGFMNDSGTLNPGYETFARDHFAWALKNTDFIQSVSTPDAARAYVNEHLDD
jgi:hypothetical protein